MFLFYCNYIFVFYFRKINYFAFFTKLFIFESILKNVFCMLLNIKNMVSLMAQMVQNLTGMRETQILSLGWEDSPREKNGNLLQYSWLENSMDRRGWWAHSPWDHKELDMTERLAHTHTHTHTHTHKYYHRTRAIAWVLGGFCFMFIVI